MKKNIMKTIAISLVFTLITQSAYPFSADKANLTPKNTLSPKHQGVSLKVLPSLIRLWYSLKDISLSRPCTVAELGENLPYISSSLPGNTEIYSRGGILLLRIYTGGKDISYLAISPSKVTEREIRDFSGDTGVQINSIEKVFSTDEFSIYAWGIPCLSRDKLDYVSIFRVFLEALSRSSPDDKRIICDIAIRIFRQFLGRNASRLNSVFACFSDGIVFSDKKGRPLQLVYRRDNELKGIDISWIPDISDIADEDSKYKIVTRCGNKYYVEKTTGVQYRDKGNKDTKLREENTLRLIIIGSYIISFWIFAQNILIAILEDYFTFGVLLENIIYVIPTIFIVNFLLITIIILFINKDKLPIHTKSITNIPILPIHSEDMPTVTVMIPVYKEPFYVIHNALSTGLEAIRYYNERAGGKANIVVSDDGLMVFSDNNLIEFEKNARQKQPHQRTEEEQEVIERLDFYRGNNIPFVARPKPVQGDVDTVREGSFKKPGNLNFTLELDMLLRDSLRNGFSYQEAVDNIRKTHRRYRLAHVEGQISIGDFIASLDKDSRIPKEFIWLDIPEFLNDPNLAFTMHETRGYEIGEQTYFGKVMTYFLHVLYDVMIHYKTRAGAYTPYMGHNGIVRRAALGEKGLWDPFMVADDLAFAMDAWKEGLYGKYITFPGLECEEAISDNFSDESSKHRRYLFSILQIYLNPIKKWLKEGFWGLKGREFLGSKKVSIWIKLDLLMYAFSFMSILLIIPISILSVFGVTLSISPYILLGFIVWLAFVMIIFHIQSGYYKDGNVPKGIINDILSNTGIGIFFVAIGPRLIRSFIEFFKNKQPDFGSTNVDTKRHTTFRKLISLMKPEIINSTILSIITVFLGVFLFIQNKPLFELCLLLLIVCIPLLFNPAFMSKLKEEVRARYRYGKVIFAIGIIGLIIYAFIAGFGWLNWKTDEFIHYNYDRPVQEFAYKHYQEHSPPHLYPTPLIDSGSDKTGPSPEGGGYKKTSSPRGKENKKSRHGGFEIERYWSLETLWSPIDGNGDYKSLDTRVQEMWELYNKEDCGDAMIVANNITREFGGIAEEQNEKKGVYFAYDPGDISTKDIINSYWALNSVASAHYIAAHCAQKLNLPGTALWHINKLYEVYYNAQIYDPVNDWFWSPVGDELWELEESGTASLDSSGKESPPSLLDSQLSDDELIEKYWEKIVEAFNGDTEKAKEYVKKYKELPPGEKKKVKDYIIGLGLFEKSLYWVVAVEAVLFAVTYLVGILFPIMLPIPFAFFIINSLQLFYLYTAKYREHIYPIITDFLKFGVPVKEGISSTDRLRIYFNPAYMSRLPVGIQKTIFFHERLHKGMAILKTPYLNIVRNAIEEFILHLLDNIYLAYYFFSRSASVRDKIDSSILDDLSEELGLSDPERDLLKRLMLDKRIKYDAIVNRLLKKDDLEDVIERLRRALRLVELRIPDLGIEDKLKLVYSIVYIDYKGAEALPLELEYSESYAPETLDEFICWLRNILESKKLPDYIADGILDVFLRKHIYKCTNETFNGFIDKLGCLLNRDIKRFKPIKEIRRNLKPQEDGEIDEDELPYVGTGEYRVMYKIRRPKGLYYKISFLIDLSGSMRTGSRIEDAIRGLIVLLETIEDWPKDIVFEVAGFSSSDFIPIWDYEKNKGKKKLTLADKVMIIKKVYNLGQGGTNAARAVEEAVDRIKQGDKKFRRIILTTTDGELFGDDAGKIRKAQDKNPFARIVPLGIGPEAGSVKDLPNGHWVPDPSRFPEVIYKIMDDEFRQQANGRHGMVKGKPVWGQQMINSGNSANMVSPNLDAVGYAKRQVDKTRELLRTLKDRIKQTGMHVYIDKECLPQNQRFILSGTEWQKRKDYFKRMFPGYSFEIFNGTLGSDRTKENTIILAPASGRTMYKDLDARLLFIEGQSEDNFFHLESFVYLGVGLLNLSGSNINGSPMSSIVNRIYKHITGSDADIRAFLRDYRLDIILPPVEKFYTRQILELQSYAANILMQSA